MGRVTKKLFLYNTELPIIQLSDYIFTIESVVDRQP